MVLSSFHYFTHASVKMATKNPARLTSLWNPEAQTEDLSWYGVLLQPLLKVRGQWRGSKTGDEQSQEQIRGKHFHLPNIAM